MSASNFCIYLPIQTDSQSLRLEDAFNGKVTLHTTMLNGDDLSKLPLSQVHVGTGSCLTIAILNSSKLSFPSLFAMPQASAFCNRTGAGWLPAAAGGKQKGLLLHHKIFP